MAASIRRQAPFPVWTVAFLTAAVGTLEMPQQEQTKEAKTKAARGLAVILFAGILVLTAFHIACAASEDPTVVVFYKEGCPDCRRLDELLNGLSSQHSDLMIGHYEISDPGAQDLLSHLSFSYGVLDTNYPIVFVGDKAFVGVSRARELDVRNAIVECISRSCPSPLSRLKETSLSWNHVFIALGVGMFLLLVLLLRQQ